MTDHRPRRPGAPGGEWGEHAGAQADGRAELRELVEPLRGPPAVELAASRQAFAECRAEVDRLRERLASFERERAVLEQQIVELGNLHVVMERLHGALDRREVLAALQDVVINVIGSEELAIFEPSEDGRELRPVQTFGVETRRLCPLALGAGPIGRAAAERKAWIVGDGPPPAEFPDLTACVPLQAGGRVAGVLAIWRMLGHKPILGDADRNVLELVARHAATALHLTSSERRREPRGGRAAPGASP